MQHLLDYILAERVLVCTCKEQMEELKSTFRKPKLQKYFNKEQVQDFFEFLTEYAQLISIQTETDICRDKKDNYLVSLAIDSNAHYMVTGDDDLLILEQINTTKIIRFSDFEKVIRS